MRGRFDGNTLLYHSLMVAVLGSFMAPLVIFTSYNVMSQPMWHPSKMPLMWLLNAAGIIVFAVTIVPLLRWVQPRIHHLAYAVDEPLATMIGQMSESLTGASPGPSVLAAIAETIAQTVKLPYVRIETTQGEAALYGTPAKGSTPTRIAINYIDDTVGWLEVTPRLPKEPLSLGETTLLNSLARQVGITLHSAQISEALQASRERLVTAREEERRRMRRDLHDGLGPTLAALQLQLGSLRRVVDENPGEATRIVEDMIGDVRNATAEIRRLVYDLRPPLLDELGLVAALQNLARGEPTPGLEIIAPTPMPVLPAAVEVAVYRIAGEAFHNVLKHAYATKCTIRLDVREDEACLDITDDGRGVPDGTMHGMGLHSMQERAAELGGTFAVRPVAPHGTHIEVRLPLAH